MSRSSRSLSAYLLACLLLSGFGLDSSLAASLDSKLSDIERRSQQREALLVIELLQGMHYLERPFREFSVRELIERYTDDLDPGRCLFLTGDIDFLIKRFERSMKPVYLFKGDLRPAFEIHDLFSKRVGEWETWMVKRLGEPFVFATDESFEVDRSKAPRPGNLSEQAELYERSLKARVMTEMLKGLSEQKAVAAVMENAKDFIREVRQTHITQVRERFLNSLLGLFDPHSGYFSRDSAELFEMEMSGVMVGIGLDLRQRKNRFYIRSVHEGGPADLLGSIYPGDELISLAEKGSTPLRLEGRGMRDVSKLLVGSAGTELCLVLRSGKDAPERQVTLARGKVNLGLSRVRGSHFILPWQGRDCRLGLIHIPAFYGTEDGASMSADVKELLIEFSKESVEGIIIDLRDNGGGLIKEAVSLAGLFLRKGTIALSKGLDSTVVCHNDEDESLVFAGPLVVLTSKASASASELFAGAMKCYGRALVVGETRSYGKGSLQGYMDLRKSYNGAIDSLQAQWGMARVTQQLYFIPDGTSPQLNGVTSDLAIAAYARPGFMLESDKPKALPSLRVPAAPAESSMLEGVASLDSGLKARLLAQAGQRIATLPEHDYLRRACAWYDVLVEKKSFRLNLEEARRTQATQDAEWTAFSEEYRKLRSEVGYKSKSILLTEVSAAREAHQKALKARLLPDGKPCLNRFHQDLFYFEETPGGKIRELSLQDIEFDASLSDAPAFAELWSGLLGRPVSTDAMRALLSELARPQRYWVEESETKLLFTKYAGPDLDAAKLETAINAFLLKAAQNDLRDRRGIHYLDITLREGLRCCADWLLLSPSGASKTQ